LECHIKRDRIVWGLYEKYDFSMYFDYGPILNQILNDAKEFKFYFPSENLETNGFEL
jgi:hypothetical protein